MRRALATVLVVAAALAGCSSTETSLDGGVIFGNNCARCHSSDLSGRVGPPLDAGSEAATKDDGSYRGAIRNGPGAMPSFDGFSDQQLEAVIAFIRSRQ